MTGNPEVIIGSVPTNGLIAIDMRIVGTGKLKILNYGDNFSLLEGTVSAVIGGAPRQGGIADFDRPLTVGMQ
jgi:hypothetical protein